MDEILRAKRLTQEILKRAASIKEHMQSVNQSMANMHLLEQKSQDQQQAQQQPSMTLLDLPDDCLEYLTKHLKSYKSICAVAQVCKRLQDLINNDNNTWERMCRDEWGVVEQDPATVPRLDTSLLLSVASTLEGVNLSDVEMNEMKGNVWRNIYRDRTQGWRLVMTVLDWLRNHGSPSTVSGSMHRLQLHLALHYMMMCTAHPHDLPRRQQVLGREGILSLLALLDNDSGAVQEMAIHVLANLMQSDDGTKCVVMVASRMGKLFTDKLDHSRAPGVVKQASRALVNLWAEEPVRAVVPLTGSNEVARPQLESGSWQLQEYSLRGECMRLVHVMLSFKEATGHVTGAGYDQLGDVMEEFELSGQVDRATGEWTMQRTFLDVECTILYRGYSDMHGAWGVYTPKRADGSAASFIVSSVRSPRIFRLFRNADLEHKLSAEDQTLLLSPTSAAESDAGTSTSAAASGSPRTSSSGGSASSSHSTHIGTSNNNDNSSSNDNDSSSNDSACNTDELPVVELKRRSEAPDKTASSNCEAMDKQSWIE